MQLIEDILPVEYYHQLAGVMVDSAIILEKFEKIYKDLYKYMKEKGFDIFLNNLIFKFLVSLFIENTHPSIYLPVIDCLFIYKDIILHRACLIILSKIREAIFNCKDLGDASNLFDFKLKELDYPKFASELITSEFSLNMETIKKQRQEKLPKILENIKKMNKNSKKTKQVKIDNHCDLDWPYCIKTLQEPNIENIMKFKIIENLLIENDYFNLTHNIKKLNQTLTDSTNKKLKEEKNELKKKTLIYGNLLMNRPMHECGGSYSSREKILGRQSKRQSSLMFDFFEQREKKNNDVDSNSSDLMEMIHNRSDLNSDIDRSVLIESVIDLTKNDGDNNNEDECDLNKIKENKESPKDEDNEKKLKK